MYDEFERAVTGKPKKGIPVFGWVLIVMAFLFLFGVVGVGFAAYKTVTMVKREVSSEMAVDLANDLADMQQELQRELDGMDGEVAAEVSAALREVQDELELSFGDEAPLYTADLFSRMSPVLERLIQNPAAGMALLEDLGSSDTSDRALRDVLEGSLRIRTDDGEMLAQLWSGEDGGSLVIQGSDGEDLTLDLVRGDDGGALVIQSSEGNLKIGAGSEAAGLPGWLPEIRGIPDHPKSLFSVESDEGSLGAVTWKTDQALEAVLKETREVVSRAGYRIREEHSARGREQVEAGFWAENSREDRVIFLSASSKDGVTRILLGYGEEMS